MSKDIHRTPITITIGIGALKMLGVVSDIVKKFKLSKFNYYTFCIEYVGS
jgi:hypothetical protein